MAHPEPVVVLEKPTIEKSLFNYFASLDSIVRPVADACTKLQEIRRSLNLPNLGTVEKMQNEVKSM